MWIMWITWCISGFSAKNEGFSVEKIKEKCEQTNVDNVDKSKIEQRFCAILPVNHKNRFYGNREC